MRFRKVVITNFRAIAKVTLEGAGDMVVISGPNGCGKSCILDALRLFKSTYGGYDSNEWNGWFGEFQLEREGLDFQARGLLRDRKKPATIEVDIELSAAELSYIAEQTRSLAEDSLVRLIAPEQPWQVDGLSLRNAMKSPEYQETIAVYDAELTKACDCPTTTGRITISPDGKIDNVENRLLSTVFSTYKPEHIGIVDYHGPNRSYGREQIGGVNLNTESLTDQRRQFALYNYGNKYSNIKAELAGSYVADVLAREHGGRSDEHKSLSNTLRELFGVFFPGKEYLGPQLIGGQRLDFPVRLSNGSTHDLNELSSGEKELLFGYLRLRNSSPKSSVILIDEPELHLNPRMLHGLAGFYQRHLVAERNCQLWLITHSDALLREAVEQPGISVFHMRAADSPDSEQLRALTVGDELDRAIVSLVGDLAQYNPDRKTVFFEGEDSEFDVGMVQTLFPEFAKACNAVSAGNKSGVRKVHELLSSAARKEKRGVLYFSVTDKDALEPSNREDENIPGSQIWSVYHIENFLLSSRHIAEALDAIAGPGAPKSSVDKVEEWLRECAETTLGNLLRIRLQGWVRHQLLPLVRVPPPKTYDNLARDFHGHAVGAAEKAKELITGSLSESELDKKVSEIRSELEEALRTLKWKEDFRGRDVLKEFVCRHVRGVNYERFRNIVITRMAETSYQPTGMAIVIDAILRA